MSEKNSLSQEDQGAYPSSIKVGVAVLSILIIFVLVTQLKNNLVIDFPDLGDGNGILEDSQDFFKTDDETLKQQDSDGDGLSDFEELKVYGTSPFIADTDSDGITDVAEVQRGTDPTCPKGQTCFGASERLGTNNEKTSPFQTDAVAELLNNPQELRQLLISAGADPIVVGSLDNVTLQAVAKESFDALIDPTTEKIEYLQNLDAEQIRDLLISAGADSKEIESLSDEELLQIYKQALSVQIPQ